MRHTKIGNFSTQKNQEFSYFPLTISRKRNICYTGSYSAWNSPNPFIFFHIGLQFRSLSRTSVPTHARLLPVSGSAVLRKCSPQAIFTIPNMNLCIGVGVKQKTTELHDKREPLVGFGTQKCTNK